MLRSLISAILACVVAGGCAAPAPLPLAESVDLPRFMGDWYVLAHIPASVERDAFDAVETYRLDDDGTIETTYAFRKGGPDGPRKELNARGFIHDPENNADWRMQFVWPFRAEYLIAYVDEDYTQTIIARTKRDMAWIMARTPSIDDAALAALIDRLVALGYDREQIRLVPQST